MAGNALVDKSLLFGGRIVKLYRELTETKREYVLSKQLVRSGTSIGANINEANYGQSKAVFTSKMQIALKETGETEYWLKLLHISEIIDDELFHSYINDCLEIKRMLVSTVNTSKNQG